MYSKPVLFSEYSPSSYVVAPFWAQNDISHRVGHVAYEVHNSENSVTYLSLVSAFISGHQQVHFNGTWMLLAEWNSVPQFQGSVAIVSHKLCAPRGYPTSNHAIENQLIASIP